MALTGLAFRKHGYFNEDFNSALQWIRDTGIISKLIEIEDLKDASTAMILENEDRLKLSNKKITLSHLLLPFIALFSGLILALFTFVMESMDRS